MWPGLNTSHTSIVSGFYCPHITQIEIGTHKIQINCSEQLYLFCIVAATSYHKRGLQQCIFMLQLECHNCKLGVEILYTG